MALSTPLLAVRGSEGIYMLNGPPKYTENVSFTREDKKNCKSFIFSRDGSLFAWCNGEKVNIVGTMDGRLLHSFDLPKVALLAFSSQNSILATWQPYIIEQLEKKQLGPNPPKLLVTISYGVDGVSQHELWTLYHGAAATKNNTQGDPNLHIWNLKSGQCLKSFFQKKMQGWCPCWSDDESICARNVNNEVQFFDGNAFDKIAHKLHLQKVSDFALSPGPQPCKVAVYVPGSKGAPSFVRLYQYPNFDGPSSALANKSFFKADKVTMLWNKKGTALLVIASTDVDKSGASYYGEQTLHYIASNGETALVQLPKNGPIYDVVWNPNSLEFCVVYGFMPAKVTVFNQKCDPVFDFGTGPRNAAFYSPQGHILVLAGFGNLRGQMEVWDVKKYKQISKPQAPDTTYFSWCPDGEHIVTATCAPRLRVSNGFKIWHYSGVVHHKVEVPLNSELWEVQWQPFVDGVFPEKAIKYQTVPNDVPSIDAKPAQAYRPPALRNKPVTSTKLHEEEPPQNMKPQTADKQLSKAALKNQKKREARKAAKQQESRSEVIQEAPPDPEPRVVPSAESHGDPEIEKKIKNIKKKLKAIEQLKEQEASGKQLEKNQLEKMQKEEALLKELEDLELGL